MLRVTENIKLFPAVGGKFVSLKEAKNRFQRNTNLQNNEFPRRVVHS